MLGRDGQRLASPSTSGEARHVLLTWRRPFKRPVNPRDSHSKPRPNIQNADA